MSDGELEPTVAQTIYKLGYRAGERAAHERYWEGYIDGMADAVPPGTSIVIDPTAQQRCGIPDLDTGPDSAPPCRIPELATGTDEPVASRTRTDRAAIRPCRPSGRRERTQ